MRTRPTPCSASTMRSPKVRSTNFAFVDALTTITRFDRVNVGVLNGAGPTLRARALTGRGLYENERGAYAIAQMAALGEWRDTAKLRRLDLGWMAG